MWNEKELLNEVDNYFENTNKEQFEADLKKTNSLHMTEEVAELKPRMTETEMQKYANQQEGYDDEFLYEYALKLGYESKVVDNAEGKEQYLFTKK